MHRAAPYAALWRIISPHGKISDAALAALSHRIFGHTSINVYSVIAVEVVTIDGANHMICCGHVVAINISALINDYWGRGVMLLLVLCLVIPGSHGIIILLPPPPLIPSGGSSTFLPCDSFSST